MIDTKDSISKQATDHAGSATNNAKGTAQQASDKANAATDSAKDTAQQATDKAGSATEDAKGTAKDASNKSGASAEEAKEASKGYVQAAVDMTSNILKTASDTLRSKSTTITSTPPTQAKGPFGNNCNNVFM